MTSLDNSPEHIDFCRARVTGLPVEIVLTDSRPWLRDYVGRKIDGLYLDSMDTYVPHYQDCCLEEIKTALPHLTPDAVVMIDDTFRAADGWSGKGALAVPWLISRGWIVRVDGWQAVLTKLSY